MKPITILGGGIAGLSFGIALRQEGIPVTIREAGTYPRHRVCGEFISGKGQEVIRRLGLSDSVSAAGGIPAETGALFCGRNASPVRNFAEPALCISRYKIDALLASEFQARGGTLITGLGHNRIEAAEGVVMATGRVRQSHEAGRKWYGLKAHAKGARLGADLELHTVRNGYVGICRLAEGLVNACGLFNAIPGGTAAGSGPLEQLRGEPGSVLHDRLGAATFLPQSFCSVAGLAYKGKPSQACAIGDAFWPIPPATGNGMSMALESAWITKSPIAAYCTGETSWEDASAELRQTCEAAFARRLFWGRLLHSAMMSTGRTMFAAPLLKSEFLWSLVFRKTRAAASM